MYAHHKRTFEQQTIYAFARCEQWLDDFCRSNQIPSNELTTRVAELLLAQTSGQVLGTVNNLSALRGNRAVGDSTTREVEMVSRPHRETQVKQSWAAKHGGKLHWTQTPSGKRRLKNHMNMMRHKRLEKYGK